MSTGVCGWTGECGCMWVACVGGNCWSEDLNESQTARNQMHRTRKLSVDVVNISVIAA